MEDICLFFPYPNGFAGKDQLTSIDYLKNAPISLLILSFDVLYERSSAEDVLYFSLSAGQEGPI
jgi:hypothetical protein